MTVKLITHWEWIHYGVFNTQNIAPRIVLEGGAFKVIKLENHDFS